MPERLTWTSPSGQVLDLTGDAYRHLDGKTGRFFPGVDLTLRPRVQQAGSVIARARHTAREMLLPLTVRGTSWADIRTKTRTLVREFDPVRGDGTLTVETDAGDTRVLICRVLEGLEGSESWETRSEIRQQFVLRLIAASEPFWQSPTDIVSAVTSPTNGVPLTDDFDLDLLDDNDLPLLGDAVQGTTGWFPFLPITLVSSEVVGVLTIGNPGDVDVWPVITITGPITDPVVIDQFTGRQLAVTVTLGAGQQLVLDARPTARTATGPTGNLYSAMTSRDWFALRPGANSLRFQGSGIDAGVTAAAVVWRPGYLSV